MPLPAPIDMEDFNGVRWVGYTGDQSTFSVHTKLTEETVTNNCAVLTEVSGTAVDSKTIGR